MPSTLSPPCPLPRVLVVDDEASVRLGCVLTLRADGWLAEGESSAVEALRRLRDEREKFDVVVLDYAMPDLDGLTLVAALDAASRPPILLASAHATGEVALAAMRLGVWDFLAKPLIPEELRRRVRRLHTRAEDARVVSAVIPRALECCRRQAWDEALQEFEICPLAGRVEPADLLMGLIAQVAGRTARAKEAFARARWWPEWHLHDAEVWQELARRLG